MTSRPSDTPLVSVVVPAYNAASTIEEMIRSVLSQTVSDLELVICNDASSDDTVERILAFQDPRIQLLTNPINVGEGASRDRAIDAARGIWVAVLDADDAWTPNRLERLLEAVGDEPNVMAFDNIMVCHHTVEGLVPWRPIRRSGAFSTPDGEVRDVPFTDYVRSDRLLIKPIIPRAALLATGVRHSTRTFAADSEYFIRLGIAGIRFRYLAEPLYLYRVTPGSATASARGRHLMRECLQSIVALDRPPAPIVAALNEKILALEKHEKLYALADALRAMQIRQALKVLVRNFWLLTYSLPFLLRRVLYHVHRISHAGQGR